MVTLGTAIQSHRMMVAALQGDLQRSVRSLAAGVNSDVLPAAMNEVLAPYLTLGSEEGATFFEEQRRIQGGVGTFMADTITTPETERVDSIVAWALSEHGGDVVQLGRVLQGAASRLLTERVNDTMIGNMEADVKTRWRYQRVPRVNCCAFCGMLATRGAVYTSAGSAGSVVGAGVPVTPDGEKRKRGGQGKGIKPRGSRRLGEDYHDNCYCAVTAVKDGEPLDVSENDILQGLGKWQSIYDAGLVTAGENLKPVFNERETPEGRVRRWGWVDTKTGKTIKRGGPEMTNRIINAMRRDQYALIRDGEW